MYSLNAPVPDEAIEVCERYRDRLGRFERVTTEHSLLVKRFHRRSPGDIERLAVELDDRLAHWSPIPARIDRFDVFVDPPAGRGPVVYLHVESRGLVSLHRDLVDAYGTVVPVIEGDRYVPHVTVARGGERTEIASITGVSFDPIDWTIDELRLWDGRYEHDVRGYALER
ncbi:MAG: 2'-5' RNA ligase family protein [Halobacteriota archaeon]